MTQSLDLALSASIILNAILAWVGFLLLGKRMILKDELNDTREDLMDALSDVDALINRRDALQRQLDEAAGDRAEPCVEAADESVVREDDPVNHPKHYCSHPSGVECITVVEHYDFVIGNIIKYAWRAGLKDGQSRKKDLAKCAWYANRAVERENADPE